MLRQRFIERDVMDPKYKIGQKIIITPVKNQQLSPRDADIKSYTGQVCEITNYYWINPPGGKVFCLYTARIGTSKKEIVLHEDEVEAYIE